MTYYDGRPPNQKKATLKWTKLFFVSCSIVGALLFYWKPLEDLGGLGLGLSLFSLVSFFHFNKRDKVASEKMDTNSTTFFLVLIFSGILIAIANKALSGPYFYNGIAIALSLIAGISYCIELLLVWYENT